MRYLSTKTYDHLGSTCFRQWRAKHSHCRFLHGYSFTFSFWFETFTLDKHNWVQDFGSLKPLKGYLEWLFDHTLIIAKDDPEWNMLNLLGDVGLTQIRVLPDVGCEKFAQHLFNYVNSPINGLLREGVTCLKVEVTEKPGNSAIVVDDV